MIDAQRQQLAELWDVVDLTVDMIRLQRIYFRAQPGSREKGRALDDAKAAEHRVAVAIAKLKRPELQL